MKHLTHQWDNGTLNLIPLVVAQLWIAPHNSSGNAGPGSNADALGEYLLPNVFPKRRGLCYLRELAFGRRLAGRKPLEAFDSGSLNPAALCH